MYLLNFYKFQQIIYQNGVVKMKGKKNLEKAIVLGLLLSTSVYSAAWADFTISEDGNTLISNGSPITDYKSSDFSGRELSRCV